MNQGDESDFPGQDEIEVLEHREADAVRGGDVPTLQTLWADDLIINTSNLIAGKEILLEMIKNGLIKLRSHERRPVRITALGDLVVTTGNEVSQVIGETAEFKVFVSYMNVWTRRDGNWQLLARHIGVIERVGPQPLQ